MEVNSLCKGYREFSEDVVFVIKDHLFVIVDAMSGLNEPFNPPSDGVYLAKQLKEEILSLYRSGKLTPKNFEKQMNMVSKRLYSRFVKGHKGLERPQFPDASISLVYIDVCDVHVFTIGSASAFVHFKNGKTKFISDRSIPLLDKKANEEFGSFEAALPRLKEYCYLLNKGGRRSIFSLYQKPHLKFKHTLFDIREMSEIYLCSNGYYQAFEVFKAYKTRRELFSNQHDLQDVCKAIEKYSKEDPKRIKYPRLKEIDDISAVRVIF